MTAVDTLKSLGFKEKDSSIFQGISDDAGLSHNGDHKVLAYWVNGGVTAIVEQNISPDVAGGVEIITKHPAILIMESSKGRVAIPNMDVDENAVLIAEVAGDLA